MEHSYLKIVVAQHFIVNNGEQTFVACFHFAPMLITFTKTEEFFTKSNYIYSACLTQALQKSPCYNCMHTT